MGASRSISAAPTITRRSPWTPPAVRAPAASTSCPSSPRPRRPAESAGTRVFVARSDDGGRTFGEPARVFPSNLSINTMTGVVLSDGRSSSPSPTTRDRRSRAPLAGRGARLARGLRTAGRPSRRPSGSRRPAAGASRRCRGRLAGTVPRPALLDLQRPRGRADGASRLRADRPGATRPTGGSAGRSRSASTPDPGRAPTCGPPRSPSTATGSSRSPGTTRGTRSNKTKTVFQCLDLYFAASLDGGETFLPEVRVSTQSGCADAPANGEARYRWPAGGDYHGPGRATRRASFSSSGPTAGIRCTACARRRAGQRQSSIGAARPLRQSDKRRTMRRKAKDAFPKDYQMLRTALLLHSLFAACALPLAAGPPAAQAAASQRQPAPLPLDLAFSRRGAPLDGRSVSARDGAGSPTRFSPRPCAAPRRDGRRTRHPPERHARLVRRPAALRLGRPPAESERSVRPRRKLLAAVLVAGRPALWLSSRTPDGSPQSGSSTSAPASPAACRDVLIKAKHWPGDEASWSPDGREIFVPLRTPRRRPRVPPAQGPEVGPEGASRSRPSPSTGPGRKRRPRRRRRMDAGGDDGALHPGEQRDSRGDRRRDREDAGRRSGRDEPRPSCMRLSPTAGGSRISRSSR